MVFNCVIPTSAEFFSFNTPTTSRQLNKTMSNNSSYFDQTWIHPSSMLGFFSNECKHNLNCGCGDKQDNNNTSTDEIIHNPCTATTIPDEFQNEGRPRSLTEDASLMDNSLLSRLESVVLSPPHSYLMTITMDAVLLLPFPDSIVKTTATTELNTNFYWIMPMSRTIVHKTLHRRLG